jgi:hypothetical protein
MEALVNCLMMGERRVAVIGKSVMSKHSKENQPEFAEKSLQQAIAIVNQLINSPDRTQSEWMLRQILQERASSNLASTNLQK